MNRICKYCEKSFENLNAKVFANHVRWCDKNPKRNNYNKELMKEKNGKIYDKKYGEVKEHIKICNSCGKKYSVVCRESQLLNSRKVRQCCSRFCGSSNIKNDATKQKIRDGIRKYYTVNKHVNFIVYPMDKKCDKCSTLFKVNSRTRRNKYCSNKCRYFKRQRHLNELNKYRRDCHFKFALNSYPDEFEFDLIRKHGWYKAKNRGNNLNGVSRDHMIPIMYGWKYKISSDIIAHPANCKLMIHNNVSKGTHPSIKLESLENKIKKWDEQYNSRV
jgi:hypothetical protein